MFCARLFICALWSPAGKGLTSWLSFVVSSVSLSLSHWYPGSGVVLDCIDSWSLHHYLLLQNLQSENKSLQIELEQNPASKVNKYKALESGLESTNVKSHDNFEEENDYMQRTDLQGAENITFNMNQYIENQMSELSYEVYKYSSKALFNLWDKLILWRMMPHSLIEEFQPTTDGHYTDIPKKSECHGNPTILI